MDEDEVVADELEPEEKEMASLRTIATETPCGSGWSRIVSGLMTLTVC
jgi:hypothetical protein